MGTRTLVLLLIINVKMSYLQPCKESTWGTSITVQSNARIGEVVFTVPDNYDNGQLQTDIQLCKMSNYFKVAPKNGWEISVKACLPDDYIEVLHLCSDNDGICRGTLRLTVTPFVSVKDMITLVTRDNGAEVAQCNFNILQRTAESCCSEICSLHMPKGWKIIIGLIWHMRFMTINIKVMVTDVFKTDYVIDVNEGSSLGECTLLSPVCTVICTNSDKLFWISSGNNHVLTYAYGINDGFPYTLKVTCPARSKLNEFFSLSHNRLNIRAIFIAKHTNQAASQVVSPRTYLQGENNVHYLKPHTKTDSGSVLRSVSFKHINNFFLLAYFGISSTRGVFYERNKREICIGDMQGGKINSCNLDQSTDSAFTGTISTSTTPTISKTICTSTLLSTKPTITPTTKTTSSERTTPVTTIITSTITSMTTQTKVLTPKTTSINTLITPTTTATMNNTTASIYTTKTTMKTLSHTATVQTTTSATRATTTPTITLTTGTLKSTTKQMIKSTASTKPTTAQTIIVAVTLLPLPTTISMRTLKSSKTPRTGIVTSTPMEITITDSYTSSSGTTTRMAPALSSTIVYPREELVGSSTFLDEPVNIVFVSTGALLFTILLAVGILCCIHTKEAQTEKNRRVDGSSSNNSDAASVEGEGGNRRARSMSSILFPSTASSSSLTPIEMV